MGKMELEIPVLESSSHKWTIIIRFAYRILMHLRVHFLAEIFLSISRASNIDIS